jgi:parallel beta-helix repeat protein
MRKILTFGIMLMFLLMTVSSANETYMEKQSIKPSSFGITLYVGGNGTGNYSKIQDAIDDSSDGDTIFVYDDSSPYYENLNVSKSIYLIGEDKETTVIDGKRNDEGEGDVVHIRADGVTLRGFTIQNGSQNGGSSQKNPYCGLELFSSNSIVEDNIIHKCRNAMQIGKISCPYVYNNVIKNNIIRDNSYTGLILVFTLNSIISDNIISLNDEYGIVVWYYSSNNLITNNNISFHSNIGIYMLDGENNTIKSNNIFNNSRSIKFTHSNNNYVLENNIYNNSGNPAIKTSIFFISDMYSHTWSGNYWGRSRILPAVITGRFDFDNNEIIPLFAFDWHPAKEPYDI